MNNSPSVIVRVYNNNLVLARDADGAESLLMGRALGFAKHPGDPVDPAAVEVRFVPEDDALPDRLAGSLTGASVAEAQVGRAIVGLAREAIGLRESQLLELAVIDHLVFAARRVRDGMSIGIPLSWEVRQLYPREVEVGVQAVKLVADRLGVALPPDESVAFALHFVNAQLSAPDLSQTMAMTTMISTAWAIASEGRDLDLDSIAAARFVTHLRHLFNRLQRAKRQTGAPGGLMMIVEQVHPDAYAAARRVGSDLATEWGRAVADDEVAYLAIHIARLWFEAETERDLD